MPVFLYVHPKTTELTEKVFPIGKAPKSIKLKDGTVCKRALMAELASQGGQQSSCWPNPSNALAVHPSQSKEFSKFCAKNGVATQYDDRGRPLHRSKKHRKMHAELMGATDFDGGYGDPNCG